MTILILRIIVFYMENALRSTTAAHGERGREAGLAEAPDAEPVASYSVGYRRPPAGTPFRPGHTGNPRGRPKGARNLTSVIGAAVGERVAVKDSGRRMTKLEATVTQLANRAAKGEMRATQLLLALVQRHEAKPDRPDADRIGENDALAIAEIVRRVRAYSQ